MKRSCGVVSILVTLALTASLSNAWGQETGGSEIRNPRDFFPGERPQVLVVGSFHFHYPGFDAHQTEESDKVDVLSEPKRSELRELIEYIERFRPNKVAIEAEDEWNAEAKYAAFLRGDSEPNRDERYQLGFRIAADMELATVYSIDAGSFLDDLETLDEQLAARLFEEYDFRSDDPMDARYSEWYEYRDRLARSSTLLDYFRYLNSPESLDYSHGAYMVGDFRLGEHRGADALAVYWYNRNLRIFRKLQRMTGGPEDRILVVIGHGHAALLKHFLVSSPEYDFIEFGSL